MRRARLCVKSAHRRRADKDRISAAKSAPSHGERGAYPASPLSRCARGLIEGPRRLGEGLQRVGQVVETGFAARRGETLGFFDRLVPDRRPDAVACAPAPAARRASFPKSRSRRRGRARGAGRGDRRARPGLRHRRGAAEAIGGAVEEFDLRGQADFLQGEVLALQRIGGEHRFGRANQKDIEADVDPFTPEAGDHVMRHMLLVPDRLAPGTGPSSPSATTRQSFGCDAMTASRMGWSRPVASR